MEVAEILAELNPLFEQLDAELEAEGEASARVFFREIHEVISSADSTEELLVPFQELATAAFQGFVFGPESFWTVNQVLEKAHGIAARLARRGDPSLHPP